MHGRRAGGARNGKHWDMPVVAWPWGAVVALDVLAWTVVSLAVGWWGARLPSARLAADGAVTRLRPFERGGTWYRRHLRVHRWKDRLPDAGAWFGGVPKRHLPPGGGRRERLGRYAAECRRAERVHWGILAVTPLFALWNPPGLFAAMVAYALAANIPCVVVQRYNRARLARLSPPAARGAPAT